MNIKYLISKANPTKTFHYLFVALLFILPFISYPFILDPIKSGQEIYLISIISLGLFLRTVISLKNNSLKMYTIDIAFLVLLVYFTFHYYNYSFFGFFYNYFLIFAAYMALFQLLRLAFDNENKADLFSFTIITIWILNTTQSIIGILQEFDFLNSENVFFKVVGTFINPNFLGISMMIGLFSVMYLSFFQFSKNRVLKFLLICSGISMSYIIILTQSRASWLALGVGIAVFTATSKKSILFIKNNRSKAFGILSAIMILGISTLYLLYRIDTDSVDGRAFIQKMTLSKIAEKPILGNGLFNFTGIYNSTKAQYFTTAERPWKEIKIADYTAVAFNDYLQVIFEIGMVGFLLIVSLLFVIFKNIVVNSKTRFALTLIIAFSFLGIFTSVLYNPNAMIYFIWALSVVAAFGTARIPAAVITNPFFVKGSIILLILISCAGVLISYKKTIGCARFKSVLSSGNEKIYYILSDSDLVYIQDDPYIEFQVGYEKYMEGESKKGIEMMKNSIKKNPIPKANLALAGLYLKTREFNKIEQILKMNIGLEPSRFEPRNNLLQFYNDRKWNQKRIKTAAEIVNLPVKKASPQVTLYKENALSILKQTPN